MIFVARQPKSLALNFAVLILKLAVRGGNDPHSFGVTSQRASMNTYGPELLALRTLAVTLSW
jgi:hypothetical protein